jgi:hypothetical protein
MTNNDPPAAGEKIEAARHSISADYFEPATVTGNNKQFDQVFVQFTYDGDGEAGEFAWPSPAIRRTD